MDRETVIWISLGLIAAVAAASAPGVPLIPLLLMTIALAGAAHDGSRRLVIETARRHLNDHALRTTLIVIAAAPVVFLLPVELALLMADGVLTYLEVLAAVSLIAANTRFKLIRSRIETGFSRKPLRLVFRRGKRSIRTVLARLRKPPPPDEDPAWAFA